MLSRQTQQKILNIGLPAVGYVAALGGVYVIERHSYLLFHTIVELFSVCVAFAIFMIVWNGRRFIQNNYMLFLGVAYLFVGGLDLMHALAYSGMGVFQDRGTNLPTQLWVAARYFESISLLVAPVFLRRRAHMVVVLLVCSLATCLLLLSIFAWPIFPVCFREGSGLTIFKEISESVIIGILLVSLFILLKNRSWFDPKVLAWVSWAIILTVASELMFTSYAAPYDRTNMIGHFLKLISFYLMYKALIETGLKQPQTLLYRRLKQHEVELQEAHDELEERVRQRTVELSRIVERLRTEVDARTAAEQKMLANQKQLQALAVQLLNVEDQERRKIASELHDSVGQILAFLKIELGELKRSGLPSEAAATIAGIREQVENAIKQTRTLTFEISPPELHTLGLESALEELAQRFGDERRLACRFQGSDEPKPLDDHVKNLLYRTVRELLINVAKHAKATSVDICVSRTDGQIRIVVEDDGAGFDLARFDARSPNKVAGFGLFSIRERMQHVGGRMDIRSAPGRGTQVTLAAPLKDDFTRQE